MRGKVGGRVGRWEDGRNGRREGGRVRGKEVVGREGGREGGGRTLSCYISTTHFGMSFSHTGTSNL